MMNKTFSITDLFKEAWGLTRKHLNFLIGVGVVSFLINFILNESDRGMSSFFPHLIGGILSIIFMTGMIGIALHVARGNTPNVDQFKTSFDECLNMFVGIFLVSICVLIGFVLLIIPGIIALTRLSMTFYIIKDQKMSAWSAIEESWRITKGFGWKVFTFSFFCVLIAFISIIPFGLGFIISIPLMYIAQALLYMKISGGHAETVVEYIPVEPTSGATEETESK